MRTKLLKVCIISCDLVCDVISCCVWSG